MYTLNEYLPIFIGNDLPEKGWDDGMYCFETNAVIMLRTNLTQGYVSCFAFMLVDKGWMTIHYNGKELTLHPNDIYTYSPCLPVTVIAISEDFHGYCLMVDEHISIEAPSVHDLVHIAYLPIVQLHEPKQTLTSEAAQHMLMKMREIIGYLHSTHIYKGEVLRMLYSIFLLDLQNAQNRAITHRQIPQRVEEIFIGFIRLLPSHFAEHHDIAFYADRLHISPVYLSRVVRQVTGRTVIDYINQMLLIEASFLLRMSPMSITQIADHLHFADTPSFSKFFSRLNGMSPKEYRKGRFFLVNHIEDKVSFTSLWKILYIFSLYYHLHSCNSFIYILIILSFLSHFQFAHNVVFDILSQKSSILQKTCETSKHFTEKSV